MHDDGLPQSKDTTHEAYDPVPHPVRPLDLTLEEPLLARRELTPCLPETHGSDPEPDHLEHRTHTGHCQRPRRHAVMMVDADVNGCPPPDASPPEGWGWTPSPPARIPVRSGGSPSVRVRDLGLTGVNRAMIGAEKR